MKKGEFEKAEVYYAFLLDIYIDDPTSLIDLQVDILMEYSQFKQERLEEYHGKALFDIVRDMQLLEKYNLMK